ncbi:MAG: HAMP domain-containing histidine kinase, partial [Thioalkalivibrio sp.]|nr:HAMP domain-containing histidine kinase [Thioalkalivibrio sp.]
MRLAEFILANIQPILTEWEAFAGSLEPGAKMTKLALRDDVEAILLATARDMQIDQSLAQQANKSKGDGGADSTESDELDNASALHGVDRVGWGFDIMEVVAEYRALRASVLRMWRQSLPQPDLDDIEDITRFNEAIDQSLAEAVDSYTERVSQSRRMFLAILSHDLRNPLFCIDTAALVIARTNPDVKSAEALSMVKSSTEEISGLIRDLTDFASSAQGAAMPLTSGPVDLQKLCREVFAGFRVTHPERTLRFYPDGDLTGNWDAARLRQVVSNLLGNALQHGSAQGPVDLAVASEDSTVVMSVRNEGEPIPPDVLPTIFDPLARYATAESAERRVAGSIG